MDRQRNILDFLFKPTGHDKYITLKVRGLNVPVMISVLILPILMLTGAKAPQLRNIYNHGWVTIFIQTPFYKWLGGPFFLSFLTCSFQILIFIFLLQQMSQNQRPNDNFQEEDYLILTKSFESDFLLSSCLSVNSIYDKVYAT